MASITVRNIPDSILQKIRALSQIERRSINNEIITILEKGLMDQTEYQNATPILSKESQIDIWNSISGKWEDKRKTKEIVADIYSNRTAGRDISL